MNFFDVTRVTCYNPWYQSLSEVTCFLERSYLLPISIPFYGINTLVWWRKQHFGPKENRYNR